MRWPGAVLAALSLMASGHVLAASVQAAAQATAQATAECPSDPDIDHEIELAIDLPKPRLNHDLGIAELGRKAPHRPGKRVLGLADTGLEFGWGVRFEWQAWGDGFCFWVRRTVLTIRHPSPDIYVAREYRRGSCPYRAILGHERQHMNVSREQINRYLPRLRWVLTSLQIPTGGRPVFVDSAEAAKREIRALMKGLAEPLFREMTAALRAAQAKLDSAASYRSLRKSCNRW